MRTTLTLDDDVAAALSRRRAERGTELRREVNDLLRAGLAATSEPAAEPGPTYHLPTFDPGRPLVTDLQAVKALLDDEDVERGLELCSRDRDFARWTDLGLRATDPLT